MKAIQLRSYGLSSESLVLNDIEIPIISENEVLVSVKYAAINPVDYKIVKGNYKVVQKLQFPTSLGYDFSGIITQIGSKVESLQIGDEVFGCLDAKKLGSLAEYCIADESTCCLKPVNFSFAHSASLPLVGMTVLQCLDKAKLSKGQKILIHAGSGGVGTFAIQHAKSMGAFVYTTTSSKNKDWVESLGADVVIAYDIEDYKAICSDIDVVLDTLGGTYSHDALKVLKNGGQLINIAGGIDDLAAKDLGVNSFFRFLLWLKRLPLMIKLKRKDIKYHYVLMKANIKDLMRLKKLSEEGKIKAIIDKVYSLQEFKSAFSHLESQRAKGKIVISLTDN